MGEGGSLVAGLVSLALTVWFVYFSILVVQKLDRIIELLDKK
ncbi:MAG: hypothetical protein PHQ84_03920 [Candidatus Omnitrophica bacterium]|jgi:hypothetical protein|nr:hypothetical protein [Candidatus Omnitrophota bacterium]MDD5078134.1 hypothetical protein [Candidatus Omnitrophota bacterium]MDD5724537.1 hypothetical protein [Candidatus Omnitrophota bacterium]